MANLSKEDLQIIEQEYIKCYQDVTYMAKYCTIRTIDKGLIPFDLYDFQTLSLRELDKNRRAIILKSRQMGISTLIALKAVHRMIFNDAYVVTIFGNTQSTSVELLDKIKLMYNSLPTWLKGNDPPENDNKTELRLTNGSYAKAFSSQSDSGRSKSANLVIMDEAAFITNFDVLMKAVYPIISTGGEIVILSTPNGVGNQFYNMWNDAMAQKSGYFPIKLPWDLHPNRDTRWKEEEISNSGQRVFDQEYDCQFMGSGHTVIQTPDLRYIDENTLREPIEKHGEAHEYWRWKYPQAGRRYIILVDTARGDGGDDSTIQVLDIEDNEQVAEFTGQLAPKQLARMAKVVATEWNDGLLIIENNGIGQATVDEIETIGYDNLYCSKKGGVDDYSQYTYTYSNQVDLVTGFNLSWSVRDVAVSKFEDMVRNRQLIIRSRRTYSELTTFIYNGKKAQATRGCTDDLIMPLVIYSHLRGNLLVHTNRANDMRRSSLDNIVIYKNPELTSMLNNTHEQLYLQNQLNAMGINYADVWK